MVKIRFDKVDLLLYPKFLNNGLILQAPGKSYIKNNFQVGLGKIFQSKWLDAEDITVPSNWKAL